MLAIVVYLRHLSDQNAIRKVLQGRFEVRFFDLERFYLVKRSFLAMHNVYHELDKGRQAQDGVQHDDCNGFRFTARRRRRLE